MRPSISSTTTRVSTEARYRVMRSVTLKADYNQLARHRRHARAWNMPLRTMRHRGGGGIELRAHKTLKLKSSYQREHVDAASHNTEMTSSEVFPATPGPIQPSSARSTRACVSLRQTCRFWSRCVAG